MNNNPQRLRTRNELEKCVNKYFSLNDDGHSRRSKCPKPTNSKIAFGKIVEMKHIYNDGGRMAAGYTGKTGDCGGCSESAGSALWTCIARCKICHKELNRAEHVPEHDKTRVIISAPLMAICDERNHNTLSDCNIGVELEWIMETPNTKASQPGT